MKSDLGQGGQIIIRLARHEEIPALVTVLERANEPYREVLAPALAQAYRDDLHRLGERWKAAEIVVAECAGQPVGTVTFYPDASREGWGLPLGAAGFRMLAVHPAARGQGVGRRLAEWCLDRAAQIGIKVVCIHTAAFMTTARALYERMGFVRVPQYDVNPAAILGLEPGDNTVTALAYWLALDSKGTRRR